MTEWELQSERAGRQKEKEKKKRRRGRRRRDEKVLRKELPYPVGQTERGGGGRFMAEGIFGVFSPLS